MAGFFERISKGLGRTRDKFQESFNVLIDNGPNLDEDFWEGLEEALISSDIGAPATMEIVDNLRDESKRKALPDAYAVFDLLNERIADQFCKGGDEILGGEPATLLFVGINGTGKTTTVGKIAKAATDEGRKVILGSADTFRAAAIEQLEVWANRANVELVTRKRGSDPASVCYDAVERAEKIGADLVLIDTAGRLHTSNDLMMELEKVCHVTRDRSKIPVYVILVIDATTGQNGLSQAKEFNNFLKLDALIVTKLDGTAKGGIALAVSKELNLPILKIGVGEQIEDLNEFNPNEFAKAFVGDLDSRNNEAKDDIDNNQEEIDNKIIDEDNEENDLSENSTSNDDIDINDNIIDKNVDNDEVSDTNVEHNININNDDLVEEPEEETIQAATEKDFLEEPDQEEPDDEPEEEEEEDKKDEDNNKKGFFNKWFSS